MSPSLIDQASNSHRGGERWSCVRTRWVSNPRADLK
jgi:hypothetical protein